MIATAIAFAVLFALLFLGVPIGFGMGIVGAVGFAAFVGWQPTIAMIGQIITDNVFNYGFSILPLFILMGNLVTSSRLSEELYSASHAFLGHRRGGLAMATIVACGGFSAVCGSSMATAATMAKVAMPSMRRYGYGDGLATASIAAGGTLGILIPPSVILVIYGFMTDTDIGKLFIAGIIPGAIGVLFYLVAVSIAAWMNPKGAPRAERTPWPQRFLALRSVGGILGLFALVMGGIYGGIFTPSEAAGIGATGAFLLALVRRTLSWSGLLDVLLETARTSSMMFIVLFGALIFSNFINIAGLPSSLSQAMRDLDVSPITVIFLICLLYLVLGCLLESLSMILLTIPLFYPLVQSLGFDMVWFGIVVVVVVEVSLITPPIGMNVFMLKAVIPDVPLGRMFGGLLPFILMDLARLALFILVPGIVLFLPSFMR
ncbi:MAG: TRAP transporter large permease [Alphaproteobacteria bacterium]|nr:TRAP transporter large permease [Alphaproteobacteria bacterium]